MGRPRKEEAEQVEEVVKPAIEKAKPKAEPEVKVPYWKTRGK